MAFMEFVEEKGIYFPLQFFASHLNNSGVEKVRAGVHTKDIAADVSPERLRRFLVEVDGSCWICKEIRDLCVFSPYNVLADPAFSRMDLISCRNLLIYLEPALQRRVLTLLHHALKPTGLLWLGASETIGSHRNLFDAEDVRQKIYAKKPRTGAAIHFPSRPGAARPEFTPGAGQDDDSEAAPQKEADRFLLTKFAPPGVLISADLEIVHCWGDTRALRGVRPSFKLT